MGFDFEMQNKTLELPDYYKPFYESAPGAYQLSGKGMAMIGEIMEKAGYYCSKMKTNEFIELIEEWLFYNKVAAKNGGYRVY